MWWWELCTLTRSLLFCWQLRGPEAQWFKDNLILLGWYWHTQLLYSLSFFQNILLNSLFASHVWECVRESVAPCASPTSISRHLLCVCQWWIYCNGFDQTGCGDPAGARNEHPPSVGPVPSREMSAEGVPVMSTWFNVIAGFVCSVVTDVLCYNGTHKATVLGKD